MVVLLWQGSVSYLIQYSQPEGEGRTLYQNIMFRNLSKRKSTRSILRTSLNHIPLVLHMHYNKFYCKKIVSSYLWSVWLHFQGAVCQPEEGMYFISPDVQCCTDNGEDTGNKLNQRRFLQIKSILYFFLHKEEEKPCHSPEGEKD